MRDALKLTACIVAGVFIAAVLVQFILLPLAQSGESLQQTVRSTFWWL